MNLVKRGGLTCCISYYFSLRNSGYTALCCAALAKVIAILYSVFSSSRTFVPVRLLLVLGAAVVVGKHYPWTSAY